jgi:hypothetical protein
MFAEGGRPNNLHTSHLLDSNQSAAQNKRQHGILKNELGTSRGDIKDVVDKFRLLLRRTNSEIRRFICCAPQRDKLIFLL